MDNLIENYRSRSARGSRTYGSYRSIGRYSGGNYKRTMGYVPQTLTSTTHTLGGTGGAPFWGWGVVSPNILYPYNLYEIADDIKKDDEKTKNRDKNKNKK
jgi:hypothetical protein